MADEFESRHGFSPGINEVRLADRDDQAAAHALAQVSIMPADLVTLYDSIGDITWADVDSGYFLHSASGVLLRLQDCGLVDRGAGQKSDGLVIGSNGGGLSYVLALMGWFTGHGPRHWTNRNSTRWPMICGTLWSYGNDL
ncbi:hypothetical protein ACIRJO_25615 [Streptomyces sp. NPDC102394]|uniref:hypothetical protein n=1 Tax=Streptomyces sp. NPDC102394 TaxID=3366167 RepID=UPI00380452F3